MKWKAAEVAVSLRGACSVSPGQPVSVAGVDEEPALDDGRWPVTLMTRLGPVMCTGNWRMPKVYRLDIIAVEIKFIN